jgi:DNA polymerase III alpha subunit
MSHTPAQRAKAFSEVKALGYQIVPIDINLAGLGWTALPGKKLMPSMTSCKGVGDSAVEEIMANRPYNTIEELLWDDNFEWKHSKFNKKAMEALVKIGAFGSMDIVGEGKVFNNYHHMHEVLFGSHVETVTKKRKGVEVTEEVDIDHGALIKRHPKSDPHEGLKNFYQLVRDYADIEDWSSSERAQNMVDVFGALDVTAMIDIEILAALEKKGVNSIDDLEHGDTAVVWFVTAPVAAKKGGKPVTGIKKKTRNGKEYVQIFAVGPTGKATKISVWGGKELPDPFILCCAEVKRDDFGASTTVWKLREIT